MTIMVLEWVLDRLREGKRVALATVVESAGSVPRRPGARLGLLSTGEFEGSVGGGGFELKVIEALRAMLDGDGRSRVKEFILNRQATTSKAGEPLNSLCGGRVKVSLEILEPSPSILLIGGGHVGFALAEACTWLGWEHDVADVRKEWSNKERFPQAGRCIAGELTEILDEVVDSARTSTHVFILGHDWKVDQDVLLHLLQHSVNATIGVIGSRSKWNAFRAAALEAGIDEKEIDDVRCPIGLTIGAETPEELALAMASEVLADLRRADINAPTWRQDT